MTGKLIVLEGIDGSGTTTQALRLARHFGDMHVTHEPSDGPVGLLIRQVLRGDYAPFDHTALALLFAADRRDHLRREIEPRLEKGEHVITDRYLLSSLVYQSLFVDIEFVRGINAKLRQPDLTLLLRVPVDVAMDRRLTRGQPDELFDPIEQQKRIAAHYEVLAEKMKDEHNLRYVDGGRDADLVFDDLVREVTRCIGS
jgi:dTMP kinase